MNHTSTNHPSISITWHNGRIHKKVPHFLKPGILTHLFCWIFRTHPKMRTVYDVYITARFHVHSEVKHRDIYMDEKTRIVYIVLKNSVTGSNQRLMQLCTRVPVTTIPTLPLYLIYQGNEK